MLITVTTAPQRLTDLLSEEDRLAIAKAKEGTNTFAFTTLGAGGVFFETTGIDATTTAGFPLIDGISFIKGQMPDISLVATVPTQVRVATV